MAEWTKEKQEIGNRIRDAREQRGWSCSELGIQADLTVQQISRYENGAKLPGLDSLVRIAGALQLPLSAFQPAELDQYGACSPGETAVLAALRDLSPLKKQAACEHILSIIRLMK